MGCVGRVGGFCRGYQEIMTSTPNPKFIRVHLRIQPERLKCHMLCPEASFRVECFCAGLAVGVI